MWLWLAVIFYPLTPAFLIYLASVAPFYDPLPRRLDQFSAIASGFIIFLVLWLGVLPRDLTWPSIEPRFAVPLTAYLAGLAVAALLMSWTKARA